MIPSPGRIFEYTLSEQDAETINRRRAHANEHMREHVETANGVQIHVGNHVAAGETYPVLIVRVWAPGKEDAPCNGQVMLDGNDTLWVTSVHQGEGERTFREFPRV